MAQRTCLLASVPLWVLFNTRFSIALSATPETCTHAMVKEAV